MPSFRDFYFDSSTGKNKIHARVCMPDGEPMALIQIAHGIAEYIERYDDFMAFLAGNGFIVVGNDHLGHGKSFVSEGDMGYLADDNGWWHIVDDVEILRQAMKQNYPEIPQIIFGHSMGSFVARTHLIHYPGGFDAAILSGTGNQGKALVKGGLAMGGLVKTFKGGHHYSNFLNNLAFGTYNKIYDNPRTEYDWLSSNEENVDKYIADPLCGFVPSCSLFRDMMDGVDYITSKSNLSKMKKDTPVYFMSGTKDPVGECGKGVMKAYNNFKKAGMKDVEIRLYIDGRHEMLNEVNNKEVYEDILKWIKRKI